MLRKIIDKMTHLVTGLDSGFTNTLILLVVFTLILLVIPK